MNNLTVVSGNNLINWGVAKWLKPEPKALRAESSKSLVRFQSPHNLNFKLKIR